MTPYYEDDMVTLWHGDCRQVMTELGESSVDAIVTDPPYELAFMGKGWDDSGIAYDHRVWENAWHVLKPGGHLLAFGGTRTWHRLAVAIEDAGFEVRDSIAWMYGSGFPKSLDVSKAIDKRGGTHAEFDLFRDDVKAAMERNGISRRQLQDALGNFMLSHYLTSGSQPAVPNLRDYQIIRDTVGLGDKWDERFRAEADREVIGSKSSGLDKGSGATVDFQGSKGRNADGIIDITAPATAAAQQWQGWGTALKPAFEPIVVARKPLIGTVAENVLRYGTGALNIDGCRVAASDPFGGGAKATSGFVNGYEHDGWQAGSDKGRWPANVILDESQAAELDKQSGDRPSAGHYKDEYTKTRRTTEDDRAGWIFKMDGHPGNKYAGETGGASRFFYTAKANSSERPRVDGVAHPTVKPLDLMRYLVRLVTPPGGTVLEPFAGSGTTLEACVMEGFHAIGIELTDEYLPLIRQRLSKPIEQVLL
jgi:DNA modification methylase